MQSQLNDSLSFVPTQTCEASPTPEIRRLRFNAYEPWRPKQLKSKKQEAAQDRLAILEWISACAIGDRLDRLVLLSSFGQPYLGAILNAPSRRITSPFK